MDKKYYKSLLCFWSKTNSSVKQNHFRFVGQNLKMYTPFFPQQPKFHFQNFLKKNNVFCFTLQMSCPAFVVSSVCYAQGLLCLVFVMSSVCYVQGLLCLVFVMSSVCYVRRLLCPVFVMSSVCYVRCLLCPLFVMSAV